MTDRDPRPAPDRLPTVEEPVLADISGVHGLSQAELWDAVGNNDMGALGAWAMGEATRLDNLGTTPRDAFVAGVGYAVLAIAKQLAREADKEQVAALLAFTTGERT